LRGPAPSSRASGDTPPGARRTGPPAPPLTACTSATASATRREVSRSASRRIPPTRRSDPSGPSCPPRRGTSAPAPASSCERARRSYIADG
jgi:hypothetical protein